MLFYSVSLVSLADASYRSYNDKEGKGRHGIEKVY